jgi:hypothetical protein
MSAPTPAPPPWLESLLLRLLSPRDRESISGDLHEEYVESALPRLGRFRADIWYMLQVFSFIPQSCSEGTPMKTILMSVSVFSLAIGCWLCFMELQLRHPGYMARIGTTLCIILISLAIILIRLLRLGAQCELWLGAAGLIWIGCLAFWRNLHRAHFEGFVLIISLVLIVQGLLILFTLGRPDRPPGGNSQAA